MRESRRRKECESRRGETNRGWSGNNRARTRLAERTSRVEFPSKGCVKETFSAKCSEVGLVMEQEKGEDKDNLCAATTSPKGEISPNTSRCNNSPNHENDQESPSYNPILSWSPGDALHLFNSLVNPVSLGGLSLIHRLVNPTTDLGIQASKAKSTNGESPGSSPVVLSLRYAKKIGVSKGPIKGGLENHLRLTLDVNFGCKLLCQIC
ncbi:hypothetical protein VNO78_21738 [Psophocarpus tetragonolobus]|uniref:Uncharacterized protein n=1 Tax=Psophocarpus tetragonolobus TaxID=3891 RepID=A0AAN9SBE9_PSOTE